MTKHESIDNKVYAVTENRKISMRDLLKYFQLDCSIGQKLCRNMLYDPAR